MSDKKEGIAELGPISEAIRNFRSANADQDRVKTYIIFNDSYMFEEYGAAEFVGTYRQLLEKLNGLDDENRDEVGLFKEVPEEERLTHEEGDPRYYKRFGDFTDEELLKLFNGANGDGQPYYVVWCVEDHKKVLG